MRLDEFELRKSHLECLDVVAVLHFVETVGRGRLAGLLPRCRGHAARITIPMNRCVMTTLPQMDLPRDLGILRTAAVHNRLQIQTWGQFACVGVCGLVRSSGAVRRGDTVALVVRA